MRIACPSCSAEYEVPASRLKPRQRARCARCGGEWFPYLDAEEAAMRHAEEAPQRRPSESAERPAPSEPQAPGADPDPSALMPALTATDRFASGVLPAPVQPSLVGAWVVTLIVLAGAIVAALVWRDSLIRIWPPSARILTATGQAAPGAPELPQAGQVPQKGQVPQAGQVPQTPKPPQAAQSAGSTPQ